jgi:hypothetical protein
MSSLLDKQDKFTGMVARLIDKAHELGYQVSGGEWWRTPDQARLNAARGTGTITSLHCDRLAWDLNLFKDGRYLTDTESHRPLGEWWESIGGSWGGRFPKGDANHYSLAYGGRK